MEEDVKMRRRRGYGRGEEADKSGRGEARRMTKEGR
jgi:hypothetical protein